MQSRNVSYGVAIIAALLIIAGGFFAYRTFAVQMIAFSDSERGISFNYPETYAVETHDSEGRHTIVIADKEALAAAPQNGEGPTTITIDIFPNPRDLSPETWVRTNPASNFQLSTDQILATSSQGGAESVAYLWDGLYRGESYVFENGSDIVMISVTTLAPTDQIRVDFERILRTLELTK